MLEAAGAGVRPLTTVGIADAAIEHVRDDPVLYYGIVAPVVLPLAALAVYFLDLVTDYRGDPSGYAPRIQLAAVAIALLVHARFVAQGAVAWALERKLRGVDSSIGEAWLAAAKRTLPLVLSGVVFWTSVFLGGTFFLAPALIVFPLFVLGPAVSMLEERGPVGTVFRAAALGWRDTGRGIALGFLLGLGALVAGAGLWLSIGGLLALARTVFYSDTSYLQALVSSGNPLFRLSVAGGTLVLVEPLLSLAFTLLYVDRRVRTEGFDLRRKVQLILDAHVAKPEASGEPAAVGADLAAAEVGAAGGEP